MYIHPSIIIALLILPLNLVAGLSNAVTTPLLFLTFLLEQRHNFSVVNFRILLHKNFTMIVFLCWSILSCLWSINISSAAATSIYNIILFFIVCILAEVIDESYIPVAYCNDNFVRTKSKYLKFKLFHNINFDSVLRITIISLLIANFTFFFEIYTHGFLVKLYNIKFLNKLDSYIILHKFDRGCTILSLFSWIAIGYLIKNKYMTYSLLIYSINLYMLSISDNLAGLVAYICTTICFGLMYLTNGKILTIIKYGFVVGAVTFLVLCYNMIPENIVNYTSLPDSAKHRLYIWHYVANFFMDQPYTGFGLESSRYISNHFAGYIIYKNYSWSLLPLHPHNILLQILLELGMIGLLIFSVVVHRVFVIIEKTQNLHLKTITLILFLQYFIIAMISYGMWQRWWVSTAAVIYIYWLMLCKIYSSNNNSSNKIA